MPHHPAQPQHNITSPNSRETETECFDGRCRHENVGHAPLHGTTERTTVDQSPNFAPNDHPQGFEQRDHPDDRHPSNVQPGPQNGFLKGLSVAALGSGASSLLLPLMNKRRIASSTVEPDEKDDDKSDEDGEAKESNTDDNKNKSIIKVVDKAETTEKVEDEESEGDEDEDSSTEATERETTESKILLINNIEEQTAETDSKDDHEYNSRNQTQSSEHQYSNSTSKNESLESDSDEKSISSESFSVEKGILRTNETDSSSKSTIFDVELSTIPYNPGTFTKEDE